MRIILAGLMLLVCVVASGQDRRQAEQVGTLWSPAPSSARDFCDWCKCCLPDRGSSAADLLKNLDWSQPRAVLQPRPDARHVWNKFLKRGVREPRFEEKRQSVTLNSICHKCRCCVFDGPSIVLMPRVDMPAPFGSSRVPEFE